MARLQILDDDQAICWCLSWLGELMEHEVNASAAEEEALRVVQEFQPELVLLDVRLPGLDGLAALREYRAHLPTTPVLLISAFTGPESVTEV